MHREWCRTDTFQQHHSGLSTLLIVANHLVIVSYAVPGKKKCHTISDSASCGGRQFRLSPELASFLSFLLVLFSFPYYFSYSHSIPAGPSSKSPHSALLHKRNTN